MLFVVVKVFYDTLYNIVQPESAMTSSKLEKKLSLQLQFSKLAITVWYVGLYYMAWLENIKCWKKVFLVLLINVKNYTFDNGLSFSLGSTNVGLYVLNSYS